MKNSGDDKEPSPADWLKLAQTLPPGMLSLLKVLADPKPLDVPAWRAVLHGNEWDVGEYHVVFFGATITKGEAVPSLDQMDLASAMEEAEKLIEERFKRNTL